MKKLRFLLEQTSYRGSELESEYTESNVKMYSTSELLDSLQTSNAELIEALKEAEAFELNGMFFFFFLRNYCYSNNISRLIILQVNGDASNLTIIFAC